MNFEDSPAEAALRAEARAWLDAHAIRKGDPDDFSSPFRGQPRTLAEFEAAEKHWVDRCRWWQGELRAGGWAGITWPRAFGGRGGTALEESVFAEEQARYGVSSGAFSVGIGMAGPTIIAHGTDDQKARYLDAMLRGDEVWCQLFSEPGAGSDLAGLATRAERDGDRWVVDGQKVWTSGARQSEMAILLARTDPDRPKHRGITFFLVDMATPGIDVRPLRQMSGGYHFNEVFLTDVAVPHANVVGAVDDGWRVAMTTLTSERALIGGGGAVTTADLVALARRQGRAGDPVVRQRLAALHARQATLRFLSYRSRTALGHGRPLGPEASVAKLANGLLRTDMAELALDILGGDGTLATPDAPENGAWTENFLFSLASRLGGGTDQIQRNIIGERVLGLPREPALDRDVPYRALARPRPRA
ncbi:MAG TPA: acyl-CoA dehydrogenase family protein [Acidimicrobiales bacterium]